MKKILSSTVLVLSIFGMFLTSVEAKNTYRPKTSHTYIQGPKGGCYYINSNGKKTYVDRSLCK